MHPEAHEFVRRIAANVWPRTRVVELGSRQVNGGVRELFANASYLGVDLVEGPGVDVVADAATLELSALNPPDCVVCTEVLEHAPAARAIVLNAGRLLGPQGVAIFTAACDPRRPHSAADGGALKPGEFYKNVDPQELREWLNAWASRCHVETHASRGDVYAVAWK